MADQNFTVNSGFYDAVNTDRVYSADDMNRPYRRLVSNGVFATQQGTPSNDLRVISAGNGLHIIVKAGEGIFADKWFESGSDINITVPSNTSTMPRIDSVIVQIDKRVSGRVGSIVYRTGNPSSRPSAPSINTITNVIEYRVANVRVNAGSTLIGSNMITDLRGSSSCPWITALIRQVDTSVLFEQYKTAYDNYFENTTQQIDAYLEAQQSAWQQWFENLTSELTVDNNVIMLTSNYIPEIDVTVIPTGIPSYNPDTDIMLVFVNGLKAEEGYHYTVEDLNIVMTAPVFAGQNVNVIVLKSVISADMDTAITMIQNLNAKLAAYMSDSGWMDLTLQNSVATFDADTVPAVRCQYGRVYLRGSVKNVTNVGTVIASLPLGYFPVRDHVFTTSAILNGTISATVAISITSDGDIKLAGKSGTIPTNASVSIATDWALESETSSGADTSGNLIVTDDDNGTVVVTHV